MKDTRRETLDKLREIHDVFLVHRDLIDELREEMEEKKSFAEHVMLARRNGLVACVGEKRKLTKEAVKKNAWRLDKKMK